MRIDSSSIGMESARTYSSVSQRISRLTITNGRQSLTDGTGTLFGDKLGSDVEGEEKQSKEKEESLQNLQDTLDEMKSKVSSYRSKSIQSIDTEDVAKQLKDIRQQCLDFLMKLLFPERSKDGIWEEESKTGRENGISVADGLVSALGANVKTFQYSRQYYYEETENTTFSTEGTVKCADGREISFHLNLEMSRSFQEYYEEVVTTRQISMCDPLVINLDGNIAELSDQTFLFDLDGDGEMDEISELSAKSGFLALDKNGDGTINDGTELFGTRSGNGFQDLSAYDTDHNGFIDEGDEIFSKLKIWIMDENGNKQLYSLAEKGVGAICLKNTSTDFALTGEDNRTNGRIRNTGIFLYENGAVGSIQHVDLTLQDRTQKQLNMVV